MAPAATAPESYPSWIRHHARRDPDSVVVTHAAPDGTERTLTWRELDVGSDALARELRERGLAFGTRLGIAMPNSLALVLASCSAWKLGAIPVPVRWDLPDWERERLRETVDAAVYLDEFDMDAIDTWSFAPLAPDATGWQAFPSDDGRSRDNPPDDLPDVVSPSLMGICSSGSTGTPKVIVINRPALYTEVFSTPMMTMWGPVPQPQTILVVAPMYHSTGFTTLNNLLGGDRLVIMQKFDAAQIVDLIERHRVSTFTATPTMLKRITDLPDIDERDLSSIEWILQGAAPMPPSLVERWIELIGAERILMAYGMTEALGITALRGDEWLQHRGSVGLPLRGTEVRILGPDGGELPAGETGDIYMQAPAYGGSTYLGAGALDVTSAGLATVGDMGHVDADGYLYLADRRVDMIISGGANVFPAEVEAALIDHPAVADVVVIGLRDPEWGQRVHAIIEPKVGVAPPSADDVVAFAKSRLAAYKVPKSVEIVDVIPRSAATKVNRGALVAERETA
jgi:bile acid-coenzyme A ligase